MSTLTGVSTSVSLSVSLPTRPNLPIVYTTGGYCLGDMEGYMSYGNCERVQVFVMFVVRFLS